MPPPPTSTTTGLHAIAAPGRAAHSTRLEAFVDAAFAFALTLLVISVDTIPESIADLARALKDVPAFALSFAVIAMFWYQHVRWSRRYGTDGLPATLLSLALVFLVLVYVYPLKILFSSFMAAVSGGWLPSSTRIGTLDDLVVVYLVYGLGWSAMWLCITGLYLTVRRRGAASREEAGDVAGAIAVGAVAIGTGVISIALALLLPLHPAHAWIHGLPGLAYVLMNLAWPLSRRAARRAEDG